MTAVPTKLPPLSVRQSSKNRTTKLEKMHISQLLIPLGLNGLESMQRAGRSLFWKSQGIVKDGSQLRRFLQRALYSHADVQAEFRRELVARARQLMSCVDAIYDVHEGAPRALGEALAQFAVTCFGSNKCFMK